MKYKVYADGTIISEDMFVGFDSLYPYYDDFYVIEVPDIIVEHIENEAQGK